MKRQVYNSTTVLIVVVSHSCIDSSTSKVHSATKTQGRLKHDGGNIKTHCTRKTPPRLSARDLWVCAAVLKRRGFRSAQKSTCCSRTPTLAARYCTVHMVGQVNTQTPKYRVAENESERGREGAESTPLSRPPSRYTFVPTLGYTNRQSTFLSRARYFLSGYNPCPRSTTVQQLTVV